MVSTTGGLAFRLQFLLLPLKTFVLSKNSATPGAIGKRIHLGVPVTQPLPEKATFWDLFSRAEDLNIVHDTPSHGTILI